LTHCVKCDVQIKTLNQTLIEFRKFCVTKLRILNKLHVLIYIHTYTYIYTHITRVIIIYKIVKWAADAIHCFDFTKESYKCGN
jgi:hypothetical protein